MFQVNIDIKADRRSALITVTHTPEEKDKNVPRSRGICRTKTIKTYFANIEDYAKMVASKMIDEWKSELNTKKITYTVE